MNSTSNMIPQLLLLENPERKEWHLPLTKEQEEEGVVIRHNSNGPAVTTSIGYEAYYFNGLRHRVGGPAIKLDKFECYYENGKAHRLDGPAKIFSDGTEQWWVNGVRVK